MKEHDLLHNHKHHTVKVEASPTPREPPSRRDWSNLERGLGGEG